MATRRIAPAIIPLSGYRVMREYSYQSFWPLERKPVYVLVDDDLETRDAS